MRYPLPLTAVFAALALQASFAESSTEGLRPPESIRAEHEEIHSALEKATRAPGEVGAAAQRLAAILHPHFVREEQIALPPLGALATLVSGKGLKGSQLSEAMTMADTLRSELPRMLEEHKRIRAAVGELLNVAREAHAEEEVRLAEALGRHAQAEEEVLYPAAILVGELVRARLGTPPGTPGIP